MIRYEGQEVVFETIFPSLDFAIMKDNDGNLTGVETSELELDVDLDIVNELFDLDSYAMSWEGFANYVNDVKREIDEWMEEREAEWDLQQKYNFCVNMGHPIA